MHFTTLNEVDCLIMFGISQFISHNDQPDPEGAYLYFNLNQGVFVKSVKVTVCRFRERDKEHT